MPFCFPCRCVHLRISAHWRVSLLPSQLIVGCCVVGMRKCHICHADTEKAIFFNMCPCLYLLIGLPHPPPCSLAWPEPCTPAPPPGGPGLQAEPCTRAPLHPCRWTWPASCTLGLWRQLSSFPPLLSAQVGGHAPPTEPYPWPSTPAS